MDPKTSTHSKGQKASWRIVAQPRDLHTAIAREGKKASEGMKMVK